MIARIERPIHDLDVPEELPNTSIVLDKYSCAVQRLDNPAWEGHHWYPVAGGPVMEHAPLSWPDLLHKRGPVVEVYRPASGVVAAAEDVAA